MEWPDFTQPPPSVLPDVTKPPPGFGFAQVQPVHHSRGTVLQAPVTMAENRYVPPARQLASPMNFSEASSSEMPPVYGNYQVGRVEQAPVVMDKNRIIPILPRQLASPLNFYEASTSEMPPVYGNYQVGRVQQAPVALVKNRIIPILPRQLASPLNFYEASTSEMPPVYGNYQLGRVEAPVALVKNRNLPPVPRQLTTPLNFSEPTSEMPVYGNYQVGRFEAPVALIKNKNVLPVARQLTSPLDFPEANLSEMPAYGKYQGGAVEPAPVAMDKKRDVDSPVPRQLTPVVNVDEGHAPELLPVDRAQEPALPLAMVKEPQELAKPETNKKQNVGKARRPPSPVAGPSQKPSPRKTRSGANKKDKIDKLHDEIDQMLKNVTIPKQIPEQPKGKAKRASNKPVNGPKPKVPRRSKLALKKQSQKAEELEEDLDDPDMIDQPQVSLRAKTQKGRRRVKNHYGAESEEEDESENHEQQAQEEEESEDDPEVVPQVAPQVAGTKDLVFSQVEDDIIVLSDSDESLPDAPDIPFTRKEARSEKNDDYCSIEMEPLQPWDDVLQCEPCHHASACFLHAMDWITKHNTCYYCSEPITGGSLIPYRERKYPL